MTQQSSAAARHTAEPPTTEIPVQQPGPWPPRPHPASRPPSGPAQTFQVSQPSGWGPLEDLSTQRLPVVGPTPVVPPRSLIRRRNVAANVSVALALLAWIGPTFIFGTVAIIAGVVARQAGQRVGQQAKGVTAGLVIAGIAVAVAVVRAAALAVG